MTGAPGVSALDHVLVVCDDIERGPRQLFVLDPDGTRVEVNVQSEG